MFLPFPITFQRKTNLMKSNIWWKYKLSLFLPFDSLARSTRNTRFDWAKQLLEEKYFHISLKATHSYLKADLRSAHSSLKLTLTQTQTEIILSRRLKSMYCIPCLYWNKSLIDGFTWGQPTQSWVSRLLLCRSQSGDGGCSSPCKK